jgi:hypothetical protein
MHKKGCENITKTTGAVRFSYYSQYTPQAYKCLAEFSRVCVCVSLSLSVCMCVWPLSCVDETLICIYAIVGCQGTKKLVMRG